MRILLLLRDASEQHQEDPIRFINWSSSRCVQSNDFRAPFRDWWCWPLTISRPYTYVRQRGFLLLPATMAHTLHPLTPLFLSSTLLTVYMEMRLSLQKLLFADIPFVRSLLLFHDEAKRRGWWYDSDLRILTTFPLELSVRISIDGSSSSQKKHRVFPTSPWDMTTIRKHRNVVRSLRKEGGAVVELIVITTLRLLRYDACRSIGHRPAWRTYCRSYLLCPSYWTLRKEQGGLTLMRKNKPS